MTMKRITTVTLRQHINLEKGGWRCWYFKMILILASWCPKTAFFKEYLNHDWFSIYFSREPNVILCSTHYTVPRLPTWNPESSELKVWQNQVQVLFTKALKHTPLGLGKFRSFYLSNSHGWPELDSGFVPKLLNVLWSWDSTLFSARPVAFSYS